MQYATLGGASTGFLIILLGGVLLYLAISVAVASYGRGKGRPFFPLFVASVFLLPIGGWALVLLGIALTNPRLAVQDADQPFEQFRGER